MRLHLKSWPALIVPCPWLVAVAPLPALIVPLPINRFHNKLAPKVPVNIPRNPPFYHFGSFLVISLTSFINKTDFSRDLTIFKISFISSFEIINVVTPDPNRFLWKAASVSDAAAVNRNGIKTLLASGLITFSLNAIQFLVMAP